jgi:lysophospholipase L1-like esterase
MKRLLAVATISLSLIALVAHAQRPTTEHWVGTWATAVMTMSQLPNLPPPPSGGAPPGGRGGLFQPPPNVNNQTLRQIVHTSLGGERVRVVFSNAFGTVPLAVGAAHVALRDKDAAIVPASDRILFFGGNRPTTIAAGASVISDPVNLSIPPAADLVVDLYLPGDAGAAVSPVTTHLGAEQTNYLSSPGNFVGAVEFPVATTIASWLFLGRVEVAAAPQVGSVVAFGDSITDGAVSTPDTNNRWPDHLARRLMAERVRMGVLNEGISGNRVLNDGVGASALARFDRDVLGQSGVTHLIVLESINDIGFARDNPSPSAADLIFGHLQLIERAHAHGLVIIGATLTPFEGAFYWTPEGEAKRAAINQWIRTSGAYDGVVDFDAVVRDINSPTKLRAQYNPGDNLHMNDAGYEAMANVIDLSLLTKRR